MFSSETTTTYYYSSSANALDVFVLLRSLREASPKTNIFYIKLIQKRSNSERMYVLCAKQTTS